MLYAMPSAMNDSVRCRRRMPTARAMPISERRSAASMMNVRKISMTPAAMEKRPKTRKNVTKIEPINSPKPTRSAFVNATEPGTAEVVR